MVADDPAVALYHWGERPLGTRFNSLDDVDAVGVLLRSSHIPAIAVLGIFSLGGKFGQMDSRPDSMAARLLKGRANREKAAF
jgi:hypothetical protein